MQFQLSGQHLEITQALRDHATARLERLKRLDDRCIGLTMVLSLEKNQHCAEGTLSVSGSTLHAKSAGEDMYASIDAVFERLHTQLLKHRQKLADKHQQETRDARHFG